MIELFCPDCGQNVEQLHEGYCEDCLHERNSQLQEHNARYDWWESLSDKERDTQINWAMMNYRY